MGPVASVKTVLFKKYATFSGRASRSEFWWFTLFYYLFLIFDLILFFIILAVLDQAGLVDKPSDPVSLLMITLAGIVWLGLLIPAFAVTARRLHDRGYSGWWILGYYVGSSLIGVIPILGAFLALCAWIGAVVILSQVGDAGTNRFGANPLLTGATRDVFA